MDTFFCTICDYIYDYQSAEKDNDGAIILLKDLPQNWTCPQCGIGIDFFMLFNADRRPIASLE